MTLDERAARAAHDLREVLPGAPDAEKFHRTRASRQRRRQYASIAAAAAGTAAIAITASVLAHEGASPERRPTVGPAADRGLVLYGESTGERARWFTIRPDGTDNRTLHLTATCATWWPDGSKILITNDAHPTAGKPLRPATISPDGSGLHLLDATRDPNLNLGCGQVAPDSKTIVLEGFNDREPAVNGIYLVRASDGGQLSRLTQSPAGGADGYPRFAPDGHQVVFLRTTPGTSPEGAGALFVTTTTGGAPHQITPQGFAFLGYNWSPDGQWIVFQRPYGQLYLVHPDGSALHRINLHLPAGAGAQNPAWSPDGTRLIFSLARDGRAAIYTAAVDGSHTRKVTATANADAQMPDWAP